MQSVLSCILILPLHIQLRLPSDLSLPGFPTEFLLSIYRSTIPNVAAHLAVFDLFTLMKFGLFLFSWRYNPLWLYFHSPVAGFSLLVFEVS